MSKFTDEECDHTIGYLKDWVLLSGLQGTLKNEAFGWNKDAKMMKLINAEKYADYKDDYKPIDFLDGRKTNMTMFNFCPDCGAKIDWKTIKKGVKNIGEENE